MKAEELKELDFIYYENRNLWERKLKSGIIIEYYPDASYWIKTYSDTTIMMIKSVNDLQCIIKVFD